MRLAWPTAPESVLYWAEAVLLWSSSAYLHPRLRRRPPPPSAPSPPPPPEPRDEDRTYDNTSTPGSTATTHDNTSAEAERPRPLFAGIAWRFAQSLLLGVVILLAAQHGRGFRPEIWFAAATSLSALTFWVGRDLADRRNWLGLRVTWEIAFLVAYVALAALWIGAIGLAARSMDLIPPTRAAVIVFFVASVPLLLPGGSAFVRSVLRRTGALVEASDDTTAHRARVIGYLERLLFAAVIFGGQYTALGFLMTAKGLVRSKELERHNFAEYFLIGTLSSITVAGVVGLALKQVVVLYWR